MKTKLRRLVIDNTTYHWAYTTRILRPAMQTVIALRVWGQRKNTQMLAATILVPSVGWIFLLPKDVRTIIIAGLAQGWQPLAVGAPLYLKPVDGLTLACCDDVHIVDDRVRGASETGTL